MAPECVWRRGPWSQCYMAPRSGHGWCAWSVSPCNQKRGIQYSINERTCTSGSTDLGRWTERAGTCTWCERNSVTCRIHYKITSVQFLYVNLHLLQERTLNINMYITISNHKRFRRTVLAADSSSGNWSKVCWHRFAHDFANSESPAMRLWNTHFYSAPCSILVCSV